MSSAPAVVGLPLAISLSLCSSALRSSALHRRFWVGRFWVMGLAAPGAPVVLHMAAERAGGRELAKLVAHHALGDEHRDVLAPVVHGDRVPQHVRDDRRTARPGL